MVAAESFQTLQNFEELFQNRYTENDKDYKNAVQEGQRLMTSVPVMAPWPKHVSVRGGGGRGNRHTYGSGHPRGRADRGSRNNRYNRGHSEYNRRDYKSNEFDHSNDYQSSQGQYDSTSHKKHDITAQPLHDQPQQPAPSPQNTTIPQLTKDITESYDCHPLPNMLDSFKDSPSKPPTESDFNAILNTAHDSNVIASKSRNLSKEKSMKHKDSSKKRSKLSPERDNPSKSESLKNISRIPLKSSKGDNMYNRTESASHILSSELKTGKKLDKQDRKRKRNLIEEKSDSENEQIDVESHYDHQLTANPSSMSSSNNCHSSTTKQPFYAASDNDSSLVVRLPLPLKTPTVSKIDHTIGEHHNPSIIHQITETTHKQKLKKHKKHHRQHRMKKTTLQAKDSPNTSPFGFTIILKKEDS